LLDLLKRCTVKSAGPDGQDIWDFSDASRAVLTCFSWGIWLVTVIASLIFAINWVASGKTDVALCEYLEFIGNFWAGRPIYLLNELQGFHYLPIMLVIGTPLGWISTPLAGAIFGLLSIAFLGWSVYRLAEAVAPAHPVAAAGAILAASVVASHQSVVLFQMQMPMTAAMICAAVAGMAGRWQAMAWWLVLAIALKPLAVVMALLAVAVVPQTRLPMAIGIAALLLAPFGFQNWSYVAAQYGGYLENLSAVANAPAGQWYAQTEISTLFRSLGRELSSPARLAIRVGAAIGTLVLAWRIAALGAARATAFALLILATCYIGLFNPRQENVSFIVVAPGIAALAMLYIVRTIADIRGWIWLALAILVEVNWRNGTRAGAWLYPGWMILIWIGLLGLMIDPRRWCDLLRDRAAQLLPSARSAHAATLS
jgi:glycosyl transferase family 87